MSGLRSVHTPGAPAALGPYSQAIVAEGWVFCAGQIPLVPESGEIVPGGITEQTDRVLTNLAAVLEAAGSSLSDVVKTTVFLSDLGDFAGMNEVYARHFGAHRPARSTVEVAALPRACKVEIECVARPRG
jgi:2-iminobutanoate/2-iminopropanoate deaminase